MALDTLVKEPIGPLFAAYSTGPEPDEPSKVKVVSNDLMRKTLADIRDGVKQGAIPLPRRPLILAQAGGSDSLLSFYTTLARVSARPPAVVVADANLHNLANLYYRILLASMHPEPTGYVTDLFGVPEERLPRNLREPGVWDQKRTGQLREFLTGFANKEEYRPESHRELLERRLEEMEAEHFRTALGPDIIADLFGRPGEPGALSRRLADPAAYTFAVETFFKSVKEGRETHYLADAGTYRRAGLFRGVKEEEEADSPIKFVWTDMERPEGAKSIRRLVSEYRLDWGKKPFQFAFIPHIKGMGGHPFFKAMADTILFAQERRPDGMRRTSYAATDTILLPAEEAPEREEAPPFRGVSRLPDYAGGRIGILSHTNIGHRFADERSLDEFIDVFNGQGVEQVILFHPIETPHLRLHTDRRKMLHPHYRTLDSQLRGLHRFLDRIEAPVTLVIGEDQLKMAEAIKRDYADAVELRGRETGQRSAMNAGAYKQLFYDRSVFDPAYVAIEQVLLPFLLRAGRDPFGITDTGYDGIIEAVDACNAVLTRSLTPAQRAVLDERFLRDTERLRVVFGNASVGDAKLFANPNFSSQTQHVNTPASLEDIAHAVESGELEIEEGMLLDGYGAHQGIRVIGSKMAVWTPHLIDDSREFSEEARPTAKPVLQDPSHKRNATGGYHNHNKPGANIIVGGLREGRFLYAPLFPRVIQNMERVQARGEGYNHYSVLFLNDTQHGSITERPEASLKLMDYWLNGRELPEGARFILAGIGDFVQARNYSMMPVENAMLGAVSTKVMQQGFVRAHLPWLVDPRIVMRKIVPGNHEWNTDKLAQGTQFTEYLQGVFDGYNAANGTRLEVAFPDFIELENGDIAHTYAGILDINNLPGMFKHTFTVRGAGKGSSNRPSSIMESFARLMGSLAARYAWFAQGHYHIFDVSRRGHPLGIVAGGMAGISGYEFDRQYGDGLGPIGVMLDFPPDGSLAIEAVTERFLDDHAILQPAVAAKGLERHLAESFRVDIHSLRPKGEGGAATQKLYRREPRIVPMEKWT